MEKCDVIVIGGGSAAFEAAVAAREQGAEKIVMLEKAPEVEYGGNARYSGTGFRFWHRGAEEIREFLPGIDEELFRSLEIPPYTSEQFSADLMRMTLGRIDGGLASLLVEQSNAAVHWMQDAGIRWELVKEHARLGNRRYFERGVAIHVAGGGVGQLTQWRQIAGQKAVEIRFSSAVNAIHGNMHRAEGVRVCTRDGDYDLLAPAIIACAGGFQANAEMRARYLGQNADLVKVRGSKHDTGEVLNALLALGAASAGQWQSAHMSPIDAKAPDFETAQHADGRGNTQSRYDYPFGISVNALGRRFFDEGEAQHSFTYAKTGRTILEQPGAIAWQIYDQTGIKQHRYPYHAATFEEAASIPELARKIGLAPELLVHTVEEFNAACSDHLAFDPTKPDGKRTHGLAIEKTNWANRIESPPFRAYSVTCGITFTFGGLRVNGRAQVLNALHGPIKGLYASGDIVGLFFHNYPAFTGQTRNVVFSRLAGTHAAAEK